jgi:WD40 repeat protein
VVLEGHRHVVSASAFSPDGTLLATGSWDHTLRLWSVPDGSPIAVLEGHRARISRIVFAGTGLVAGGDERGSTSLWTVPDGTLIRFHESNAGGVSGLLPVGDGTEILTAYRNGHCTVRNLPWVKIPAACTPEDHARVREYRAGTRDTGSADLQDWEWVEALIAGSLRTGIALCPDPPLAGGYEIELARGG